MWPWDWVLAAGSGISGLTQKAVNWVSSLIASVMSWVNSAIASIWGAIYSAWHDIRTVWNSFLAWVGSVAIMVAGAIDRFSHLVSNWILGLVGAIWAYIKSLYSWALNQINTIWHYIYQLTSDLYGWVIREVYNPLVQLYNGIRNWVSQMFNDVWQYIQNPELLVNLLGGFIVRNTLKYAKQFAVPITRWLIRNMKGLAGEVFDLLEQVLTSIL